MSYRNPQQIVDTQSGQHIQNMLKQVTGAATGTIKTIQAKYRQREKENIAEQQQIIKGVAKVANSANAADILNSGTDWAPAIREGVARYQELFTKSIKDPLKFSIQDAQEMSSLALMGTQIKQQAVEDQAIFEEYNGAFQAGVGQYDGLDKFADPKIFKRINIAGRVGATPGKSIGSFDWNPKSGGLKTIVTSYNEFDEVVGTNANNTSELPIIVNPTKNMEKIEKAIKKKNEDYFKNQKTVSEYNKETGITTKSQYTNMDQLIADVRALSDAYIEGLGAQGAIRLSNNKMLGYMEQIKIPGGIDLGAIGNIIDPEKAAWDLDENGNVNDPQLERIKIAYAKKLIDDRGLGKDPKILDKVRDKPTPTKNNGKNIIIDFKKGIQNASKNITTNISKGITYTLDQDVFRGDGKTPNPDAMYVYTPEGGDVAGTPKKVKYWKKQKSKTVDGTPSYIINLQEILDTFGSKPRKL